MPTKEWELLADIVARIKTQVPAFGQRVMVIADERLMPESMQLPACGVKRGPEGGLDPEKEGYEETYDVEIWIYDEDYTGRSAAEQSIMTLTSNVWDALKSYAPLGGAFLPTWERVELAQPRPMAVIAPGGEVSEFAVVRMMRIRFHAFSEAL